MALPDALGDALRAQLGSRARPHASLARYTSFRIGGPAELLVLPDSVDELAAVVRLAAAHGATITLLGGGSNLLVGDGGITGIVAKLGRGFGDVVWNDDHGAPSVRAGGAVQLGRLARAAVARGLGGLEYAEGIPGTVGGAVFMNSGAYGGDVSGAIDAVEAVDGRGEVHYLDAARLRFGYRRAELPPGTIVTAVRFRLRAEDPQMVRGRLDEIRLRRTSSQPSGRASAGSIFKNPPGEHAGRLIEAGGLKGKRAGRARISERHANFIVNEGGARAGDVKALMEVAQRVVWERSGIWLEPEVKLVGNW